MKPKYLPGLNALRFFAAFFVVISHANISLDKLGIYPASSLPFVNRGGDAVDFFFTLSGFLITYLLIGEINKTGTVSIRQFYLRRMYRIWPLYFLVIAIGFFLLGYIYPKIYQHPFFSFTIPEGLLMFIFFIPNYAAKNFPVGLLNPLWSIGVEEQFYLFWAPLVKFSKRYLLAMIVAFILISLAFYAFVYYRVLPINIKWEMFFLTQKFYSMAIGSLFGYLLFYHFEIYNRSFFAVKIVQAIIVGIVVWHYIFHNVVETGMWFKVFFSFLYGFLILNVSVVSKKIFDLEKPVLSYLGAISYGIYMYHMLVDYLLRYFISKPFFLQIPKMAMIPLYYIALLMVTIAVAALSYQFFEKFFLQFKERLHSNSKLVSGNYVRTEN